MYKLLRIKSKDTKTIDSICRRVFKWKIKPNPIILELTQQIQ